MAEELDVIDIEGDEFDDNGSDFDGGGTLQDQYLESAWKPDSAALPWTLDSSISEENREAIENMLLEEQYYFAGKTVPKVAWTTDSPKVKKSAVRSTGAPARWSQEERELFETGLAQFGRRWTKICRLIGTRTVLQVKTYARQYFKNKAKVEGRAVVLSAESQSDPVQSLGPVRSHLPALTNAVRIEQLSDDEDVDITDDLSDEGVQTGSQEEQEGEQRESEEPDSQGEPSLSGTPPADTLTDGGDPGPVGPADSDRTGLCGEQADPGPAERSETQTSPPASPDTHPPSADANGTLEKEAVGEESEEEQEEGAELKAPEQEVTLDMSVITEEEKQAIPEFFEGRPSKTPERYVKIRNYILDQWLRTKPRYLNKTSVRPGLKNCGDVNCIGRIHTYLELIGAINFNCDQAVYNRPRTVDRSRLKEGKDALEAYQLAQRLQSMRTRKRRVRDMWGNWCDAKDLEGQTFEHLSAEELALRREEMKRQPKPCKLPKHRGVSVDPFQLIPCRVFGEERQEPFKVIVCAEALVVMDMHAHVSLGEVIGLLGGDYDEEKRELKICAAEPCSSLSTGLQCEMDPVSQTQASEMLGVKGHRVVGWYHSHPAFDPNPSVRDIDTQAKYQSYFSRGGAPFIGVIVSPYNPSNPSPVSQITCLVVNEEIGPSGTNQKVPYKFQFQNSPEIPDWSEVMRRAEWVVFKYRKSHGSVPMDRLFRRDSSFTCLEKMLASLRKVLDQLPEVEMETVLVQIETLFVTYFTSERETSQDESGSSSHATEPTAQYPSHTFPTTQPISNNQAISTVDNGPIVQSGNPEVENMFQSGNLEKRSTFCNEEDLPESQSNTSAEMV
ncbi:histone H2A deubiquitinase MYSM1 [Chanos chanos]|uniref:Myb-like, SWIRM and MPN domain-containing protein 1 n=1 Tax=Chanos chanos TaxID=29144 RepID=A0A6J2V3K4_CHACN|nr:histone H2A deubiquitinase MYSM1 [Chanos chanos]